MHTHYSGGIRIYKTTLTESIDSLKTTYERTFFAV